MAMTPGDPLSTVDGFDQFLSERAWTPAQKNAAYRIVRLRMMRGLPSWSEADWEEWARHEPETPGEGATAPSVREVADGEGRSDDVPLRTEMA